MIRIGMAILAGFVFVGWYLGASTAGVGVVGEDVKRIENKSEEGNQMGNHTAIFAAGCFWGVEATFRDVDGVVNTAVGYIGGETAKPTYKEVCSGRTGHAEAVRVVFDPAAVSYERLVEVFFSCHDPTTINRQGPDIGTQYRSAIFYFDEQQQQYAMAALDKFKASNSYGREVVTKLEVAGEFYPAEEYHQQYLEKRGRASCLIK